MSSKENHPHTAPEELFETPSQLRVRQLLGQMSVSPLYEEKLFPSILKMSETETTPRELVADLEKNLTAFADENMMGARAVAYKHMPGLIAVLAWNQDEFQEKALDFWGERVEEQKLESIERTNKDQRLPRKMKKALRKPTGQRSAREQALLAKALERNPS